MFLKGAYLLIRFYCLINVHWLEVVYEMATFVCLLVFFFFSFFRFSKDLEEGFDANR